MGTGCAVCSFSPATVVYDYCYFEQITIIDSQMAFKWHILWIFAPKICVHTEALWGSFPTGDNRYILRKYLPVATAQYLAIMRYFSK